MKKFIALYMAPVAVLEEWAKSDAETKKAEEQKMREGWNAWMGKHGSSVKTTEGLGKNTSVTSASAAEAKNGRKRRRACSKVIRISVSPVRR